MWHVDVCGMSQVVFALCRTYCIFPTPAGLYVFTLILQDMYLPHPCKTCCIRPTPAGPAVFALPLQDLLYLAHP